ncbi:MAG: hypothetical protein ACTSU2_16340 [Promethearchaeota archaeon]
MRYNKKLISMDNIFNEDQRLLIKNIWIISNGGVLVNNLNLESEIIESENKLDPYLFSSFVSAIRSFSNEIYGSEKYLESFSIGKDVYYIFNKRSPNIFLVAKSDFLSFDNKIENLLDVIEERFYEKFNPDVNRDFSDNDKFKRFSDEIREILIKSKVSIGNYGDLNNYFPNLNNPLRLIEKSKIFSLIFLKNKKLKKFYINKDKFQDFDIKLFLKNIKEYWKTHEKTGLKQYELLSFYLNFSDFKVSGVKFYDFILYLIVSNEVELNHIETQQKLMIEQLIELS